MEAPEVRRLLVRLRAVHRRARRVALGRGLCSALLALVGTAGIVFLIDRSLDLSPMGRFVAAATLLVVAALGLALGVVRVFLRRMDPEEVALEVEGRFGGLQSLLISALQFGRRGRLAAGAGAFGHFRGASSRPSSPASPAMMEMVTRQAAETAEELDLTSVVDARDLKRLLPAAAAAVALAAVYSALQPAMVRAWVGRMAHPFDLSRTYPTRTRLTALTGDVAVPAGATVRLAVRAEGAVPRTGLVRYWQASGRGGHLEVSVDTADGRTFQVDLGPIEEETLYRFEVGDARTGRHRVLALPRPRLTDLVLSLRPPPYAGVPDPPPSRMREVHALEGTTVRLQGYSRVPPPPAGADLLPPLKVTRAALIFASGDRVPLEVRPGGAISGRFLLLRDDAYRIHLAYEYPPPDHPDAPGASSAPITVSDENPIWYPLRVVKDRPPAIRILEPGPTVDASPLGEVLVRAEVTDDYGVARAELRYAVKRATSGEEAVSAYEAAPGGTGPGEPIDRRAFSAVPLAVRAGSRRVQVEYRLEVARTGAKPGDRILYYLLVADTRREPSPTGDPDQWRDRPNVTESEMQEVAVLPLEVIERRLQERRRAIWEEIRRIYRRQWEVRREVDDLRTGLPTRRPKTRTRPAAEAGTGGGSRP